MAQKPGKKSIMNNARLKYIVPPFSILDAKQSFWRQRKEKWLSLGLQGELGREDDLIFKSELVTLDSIGGTSVFDPVLAETMLTWFSVEGATVLDPFAGGSTRGVISSFLNRNYVGIDIRPEQIDENYKQFDEFQHKLGIHVDNKPTWIKGDSKDMDTILGEDNLGKFDMVFTCPPYFNLERYSDDPNDISNSKNYYTFLRIYRIILSKAVRYLKKNGFFVIVVGNIRDHNSVTKDLVGDTIRILNDNGLMFHNDMILATSMGTVPVRAERSFSSTKRVGRVHQNVLIFYNGDPTTVSKQVTKVDTRRNMKVQMMIDEYNKKALTL